MSQVNIIRLFYIFFEIRNFEFVHKLSSFAKRTLIKNKENNKIGMYKKNGLDVTIRLYLNF